MLFRVLGPVEIDGSVAVNYIGARKPRTLLAVLLLKSNGWVSVGELIDALWADQQLPASAERNVGTYIWQLRKLLPPPVDGGQRIESRSGAYRIRVEPGELDTNQFESLLATGSEALNSGDAVAAVEQLGSALALWRGEPFEGLVTATDQPQIARLVELHWSVRERLADAYLAAGRLPEAIALCMSLTTEDPLREGAWARLLVALRDSGRITDALAAYRRARTALIEELGTEPGPELQQLHQELLAGARPEVKPAAVRRSRPVGDPVSPDEFLRTALVAADVLTGREQGGEPAAALRWFDSEQANLTAAISYFVTNDRVESGWRLCSAVHDYLEAGGQLDGWPQVLVKVAAATRAAGDRYGELVVRNVLGIAYTQAGRIPDACAEFTIALGLAAAAGDRDAEGIVLVNLAMAEAEFGAPTDAAKHVNRALHLLQDPAATTTARELLTDLDVHLTTTSSAAAS